MRCSECGRPITNAEMWQICNNPQAPSARSMNLMCWSCRRIPATVPASRAAPAPELDVVAQAIEVVRAYLSHA